MATTPFVSRSLYCIAPGMGRDLFVVLRMLHQSGIDTGILVTRDELFIVWLKEPWGGIIDAGYFRLDEATQASDWLVARALHHFPRSDFAKAMAVLAQASAAVSASGQPPAADRGQ